MIQVLAPKMPRGWSWVWFPLVLATLMTSAAPAQTGGPATKPPDTKGKPPEKPAVKEPTTPNDFRLKRPPQEIYPDAGSKQAIGVFNPLPYPVPAFKVLGSPNERSTVQSMAGPGGAFPNADQIKRYVEYYAAELSKKEHLNAFLNPGPNVSVNTARAIERAMIDLITPITVAKANNNPNNFLAIYSRQLFDSSFIKLLDNNLICRLDAMIVLGMVGSNAPKDLQVYIDQISNPEQVLWVKQWAARGLTNATNDGKSVLDAAKSILAVEALTKFLATDAKTMPWPVQMRALEALGSLRAAVTNSVRGKTDAASVVMPYLLDPEAKPEVRAWAAHSLGWMTVPTTIKGYNFALLGDAIGQVAADLGDQLVADFDRNAVDFSNHSEQFETLTALLIFEVYGGIAGEPSVKESGLVQMTHPDARAQSAFFKELSDRVQAEAKLAVDLIKMPGASQKGQRDKLAGWVKDMRAFLAAKPPKERRLVPEGPEFPLAKAR